MRKEITIAISVVVLIIAIIAGTTYSFFSSVATSNNSNVTATAEKYEIIYTGGTAIDGDVKMLSSHVGADSTTVSIGLANGVNVSVNATLFISITEISSELAVSGFKWEVYRLNGANETLVNSGTFQGATNGGEINILTTSLSTTQTSYKIYFWADGNAIGNEISGSNFSGYIGARTDAITGIVDNS